MNFNKTRFAAGLLSIAMLTSALDMTVYAVEIDKLLLAMKKQLPFVSNKTKEIFDKGMGGTL